MKISFQKLISIPPISIEQNEDFGPSSTSDPIEDYEVFDEDNLRSIARERKSLAHHYIILSAKLIAPSIEQTFAEGYDWVVETLKSSSNSEMASELEIQKSIQYLKSRDFNQAIETLKTFEKKDEKLMGTAATNLSFIYFLEGEYNQSENYAEIAIKHDRYNSNAQTNRGNCYYIKENYKKATECYQEAISVDASCTEAMYNLGLVNKKMEYYNESLMWFEKLHSILRSNAEVIYQICELLIII
jgi:intraflagellar transport protein 88